MKREMGVADASMKCARVRACAQITDINTKSREEDQYGGKDSISELPIAT